MSQQGARKVGKAAGSPGGSRCRSRSTAPKAAGDASAQPARQKHRSKSRNKIPKSVRYDLENALVGLCNVWFEDIKPHLLRNNIKVHVHPPSAGAEGDQPAGATPAPPRCRHVNPVHREVACEQCRPHPSANFADFCLTRPTASSAPSPRRRVSRRPALPSLPSPPPSPHSQGPCHNCESDGYNTLRKCSKTRFKTTSTHDKSNSAILNELTLNLNLLNLKRVRKKMETKNRGSQTECPVPYSLCARRHRSCTKLESPQQHKRRAETHTRSSGLAGKRRVRSPRSACPRRVRSSSRVRPPSRVQSSSPVTRPSSRVQSSSHMRSPANRANGKLRRTSPSGLNRSKARVNEDIFKEEFIEEIADNRDPNILLLYTSPRTEEASSVVNTETVLSVKIQSKKSNKKFSSRK